MNEVIKFMEILADFGELDRKEVLALFYEALYFQYISLALTCASL